jgi:hypothetical protein
MVATSADQDAVLEPGALFPGVFGVRGQVNVAVTADPVRVVGEGLVIEEGEVVVQKGGGEGQELFHSRAH